jgi:hypothetical protein
MLDWQANGCQGELSERSRIVLEAHNRAASCEGLHDVAVAAEGGHLLIIGGIRCRGDQYSPFVKAREDQLDSSVHAVWL